MTLPKPSPPPPPPKPQPRPRPKPPPPKPHHVKPQPKPPPPRPKPRPQPSFDFRAYASRLRDAIQRHVQVSRAIRTLGLSGTAIVEFKLNPDGHLDWVKIYRSSGNKLIDRTAEQAVRNTRARGFPGTQPKIFAVPIEIRVSGSQ